MQMIIYILGTAVSVLFAKIASAKEINGKKLSNDRKLTNNQPIASYCRDPN